MPKLIQLIFILDFRLLESVSALNSSPTYKIFLTQGKSVIQLVLTHVKISVAKECSDLDTTTWTNMKTTSTFPVSAGTVVSLSCYAGYELRGDTLVTCIQYTEFKFTDIKPTCGK